MHVYMPQFDSEYHNDSAQYAYLYATYNSHTLTTLHTFICPTHISYKCLEK